MDLNFLDTPKTFKKMERTLFKFILIFILALYTSTLLISGQDTVKCSFSFNYFKDLSDTFSGGTLLAGELTLSKSWYGVGISYGHFQSHSSFTYKLIIEEDNQSFNIPFDELAIMQTGSFSGLITPIKKNRIKCDLILGLVYAKSKNSCFKSISYSYNINDKTLTSVEKDYQLIERTHFGYQTGVNVTYYVIKRIGLQLNARIQDLSKGGTFFFVGSGLCFRL
jgi:hypothetical protein